ncbi:multinuclear nonheme iron-dependent oxidase [Hufsiella arboris]|uniref:multinuclear nonheme iron-dependent oxidase n=1 Tax=Hufsiella arboris TaxID=2695275 RepID=UPI001927EC0C
MTAIASTIACNLDSDILSAAIPLFEESRVEAIEWAFDSLDFSEVPEWFSDLIDAYSKEGRLIGHGVFFSIFSGRWSIQQQEWLDNLKKLSARFKFDHITEHFGFMTGANFHYGAPLAVPFNSKTLTIGRDRLNRIYDACQCPVGLENLAFSYSIDEVKKHGEFLETLVEPVNGFIILDLHNLYCQMHNFSISFDEIIKLYPVDRVREFHISGGSWENSSLSGKRIRRDTHDDAVPDEVYQLLDSALDHCKNVRYVTMEQLGSGLKTEESRSNFYNDFLKMQQIVRNKTSVPNDAENTFFPPKIVPPGDIIEDENLYIEQQQLSYILENSTSYDDAVSRIKSSVLAKSDWGIESWAPHMLETAISIAQKWKKK